MKILWMSPHLDSEHPLAKALASRGAALLVCGNPEEASSLLQVHGRTVDLAIVHREGMQGPDDGLGWIEKIKTDPSQSDLPLLLTADGWGDADFAQHQASPYGCNAYLRWPATEQQLLNIIESIFPGESLAGEVTASRTAANISADPPTALISRNSLGTPPPPPSQASSPPPMAPPPSVSPNEGDSAPLSLSLSAVAEPPAQGEASLVLQPAEEVLAVPESPNFETQLSSIQLDAPPMPEVASPGAEPVFSGTSLDLGALVSDGGVASLSLPPADPQAESQAEPQVEGASIEPGVGSHSVVWKPAEEAAAAPVELGAEPSVAKVDDLAADPEIAAEMPYLFSGSGGTGASSTTNASTSFGFVQPLGDAVVPGGAAQTPDLETLKKYLLLREQDVAVLSSQLKTAQDQVSAVEQLLRMERAKTAELTQIIEDQKRRIDEFDREKAQFEENAANEINDYKFQLKVRSDKVRALESQVRESTAELERLKERVRGDIRKIRVREKELENRLEILKKDSEALIVARENKIVELKRRIDLLEFNMDLLQDQFSREKETNSRLRERLARAAQVVRVAGGLLDAQAASALSQAVEEPQENAQQEESEADKKAS